MSVKVEHPSVSGRRARGKEAGNRTPPSSHAGWEPATIRPAPEGPSISDQHDRPAVREKGDQLSANREMSCPPTGMFACPPSAFRRHL